MAKPPTGRILPDLRNPGFQSEAERLRIQGIVGEPPEDRFTQDFLAHQRWLKETPEGQAELAALQELSDLDAKLAREEEECRSDRLLKGLPAYVEPKTIHAKVPEPPWKRKLKP